MRGVVATIVALAFVVAADGHADSPTGLRIIVNAKAPARSLERKTIAEVFLKKRTRWDDDSAILPVDQPQRSAVRDRFSREVLGRDLASVRHYWAQLVYSGRGVPPPELGTEGEVVRFVAAHAGAIGYVSAGIELAGVKIVEVE